MWAQPGVPRECRKYLLYGAKGAVSVWCRVRNTVEWPPRKGHDKGVAKRHKGS